MKPSLDLVIVLPVGPAAVTAFIADTLESIRHYVRCPHLVILADDSQKDTGTVLRQQFPEMQVMQTPKNLGKVAGLYINLANAYQYALENYSFKALLKLDDDALITGHSPERDAIELFAAYPQVGMAGRHIRGRFSPDHYGNLHDNYWPRKQLIKDACSWKIIRRPVANLRLRSLFYKAVRAGYELGENVQGGAYFANPIFLKAALDAGLLPDRRLTSVNFGEDLLFSLIARSLGFTLADLMGSNGPMGVAWKGLPASPEALAHDGKKVVHSTRFYKDMGEEQVRFYFRTRRRLDDTDGELADHTTHQTFRQS